jgi:protein-tyrosine phosphatase
VLIADESSEIVPGLRVGSAPAPRPRTGTIILCAQEYQPLANWFPGAAVLHAPFDDDSSRPMTTKEVTTAVQAGQAVARQLRAGGKVLVTCFAGLNRSALVAGLALIEWRRLSPNAVIMLIRAARGPNALSNVRFIELLHAAALR